MTTETKSEKKSVLAQIREAEMSFAPGIYLDASTAGLYTVTRNWHGGLLTIDEDGKVPFLNDNDIPYTKMADGAPFLVGEMFECLLSWGITQPRALSDFDFKRVGDAVEITCARNTCAWADDFSKALKPLGDAPIYYSPKYKTIYDRAELDEIIAAEAKALGIDIDAQCSETKCYGVRVLQLSDELDKLIAWRDWREELRDIGQIGKGQTPLEVFFAIMGVSGKA